MLASLDPGKGDPRSGGHYAPAAINGDGLTAHGMVGRLQRFCGSRDPEKGESGLDNGLPLDSPSSRIQRLSAIASLSLKEGFREMG